jgi:outer membrane protein OmpA-like peptidoglycan-associated protein
MTIEGHTDNTGSSQKNEKLSLARARAVYDYLVKKGIEASRLNFQGFGDARPVADNGTAGGRAKNRRVEMRLRYD